MMDSDDDYDRGCREKQNRNKFRGERQGDSGYTSRSREHRRSRNWTHTGTQHSGRSTDREDYSVRRGKRRRELGDESCEPRKRGPRSPPNSPKHQPPAEEQLPKEEQHTGNQNFSRPSFHVNPNFVVPPSYQIPPNRFSTPHFQFHPVQQWPRPEFANRMLNFKAYLATQEDDITDEEAQQKYSRYKEHFQLQQVQEFFQDHQSEEWFRQRYHPTELGKVSQEKTEAVKERLKIFMQYKESIGIDELVLVSSECVKLTKFLDNIVILLEGGSVEDILDTAEGKITENAVEDPLDTADGKVTENSVKGNLDANETQVKQVVIEEIVPPVIEKCSDMPGDKLEKMISGVAVNSLEVVDEKNLKEIKENTISMEENGKLENSTEEPAIAMETADDMQKLPGPAEPGSVVNTKMALVPVTKPRNALLNLNSIFIRALPPLFTKQEVEAMCSQFEGFKRLALADPTAERNWLRRAWATYESNANLSSVVYRMNILKPRNYSLGVMVNRKLSNRIRNGPPLSAHPRSIRTDVRLAAQLAHCLDRKHRLWNDSNANGDDDAQPWMMSILISKNPLLGNVMDYLTEEASAEEDELLGNTDLNDHISESSLQIITQFMDRLLIYLRVVHSVDFYQRCEYVNEYHMPNRCGIMHIRGTPEANQPSAIEVETFCKETVNAITKVFLELPAEVPYAELVKLGLKDKDTEVEKFIDTVTKKISDEKFQCELCSKKFKSIDFVHKHISNKHDVKLGEVASTVEFFNNFVRDSKRPRQWDGTTQPKDKLGRRDLLPLYNGMSHPRGFHNRVYRPAGPGFGPYGPFPMSGVPQRGGRFVNFRYPMPATAALDYCGRQIITYRDLDAPAADDDIFS